MKKIFLFCSAIIFISCATPQTQQKTEVKTEPQSSSKNIGDFSFKKKEYFLSMDAKLTISTGAMTQSGSTRILTAGADSVQMSINGPFGIFVGRLYARKDYFMFYDALNNQVIEGNPSAENLKKALQIPLSGQEILRTLRGEILSSEENYSLFNDNSSQDVIIFSARRDSIADYAAFSASKKNLLNSQRKLFGGEIFLNANYRDYHQGGIINSSEEFPHTINLSFPKNNILTDIEVKSIWREDGDKKFSFSVPEGIEHRWMD